MSHCICGARKTRTGLCTHCDFPPVGGGCPVGCARCRERDSYCSLCNTICGSSFARALHEKRCRRAETKRIGLP